MSVQTSYERDMPIAYAGQIADMQPRQVTSKLAESTDIGFGLVVSRGTADNQAILGGSAPIGISLRDLAHEGVQGSGVIDYKETEAMAVMEEGWCYVAISNTGSPGDALKYNTTTGVLGAGAPGGGEAVLPGTLESTVSTGGDIGLVRIVKPSA